MKYNNLDIVYTVKRQPFNEELRYSLRSLVNIPHKDVWIVGYKPEWANVNHIPTNPISRSKITNTNRNWMLAALDKRISDPFILMNDDFFINKPIKSIKHSYICHDSEFNSYYNDNYPSSKYTMTINITSSILKNIGIDGAKCYESHTPMVIYKSDIISALKNHNYRSEPVNIRTLAGNIGNYGGTKIEDVKVYGTEKEKHRSLNDYESSDFISTDDIAFAQCKVGNYIRNKFNTKSEYEL